jgi:hypothetical protein
MITRVLLLQADVLYHYLSIAVTFFALHNTFAAYRIVSIESRCPSLNKIKQPFAPASIQERGVK